MVAPTYPKAYEALPTFPDEVLLWVVFSLVLAVYWLDPPGPSMHSYIFSMKILDMLQAGGVFNEQIPVKYLFSN